MIPISATMPIRALRPGLAKKGTTICLYRTTMTRPHRTRKTSIRTRKIRGDDSLVSSISIAERDEGPGGILVSIGAKTGLILTMAQRRREKSCPFGVYSVVQHGNQS